MKRMQSPAHLKWVRTLPCIICGNNIETQAAHIRASVSSEGKLNPGIGRKPDDDHVVPLCGIHHTEQHKGDEIVFWHKHGFSIAHIITIAEKLFECGRDLDAATRIMNEGRRS